MADFRISLDGDGLSWFTCPRCEETLGVADGDDGVQALIEEARLHECAAPEDWHFR